MSENATTVPIKGLGTVNLRDLWKGLYYIIIGQVIAMVSFLSINLLQEHPHFPTWVEWLPYIKSSVYMLGGYIGGKLGINNVGQIFKKDQNVVHVDIDSYNELQEKARANEST